MRTRIKICGITRLEDAQIAVNAGVDAIGLVFAVKSPRYVTLAQAQRVAAELPPFVSRVGLFMNAPAGQIYRSLAALPLEVLQFHGDETPEFCAQFGRPWIKAFGVSGLDPTEIRKRTEVFDGARAVLLDGHPPGAAGGSGVAFDWSALQGTLRAPLVLAGGLNPGNVAAAIRILRPTAVDVSSGVERSPGLKDTRLIQHFVDEVRRADNDN